MGLSKGAVKRNVEKACVLTHIAVMVESVREFRETFKRKILLKESEKVEIKKKGKSKKPPVEVFCPDAETDIPKVLQEFTSEIKEYYDE